jgi:tryptophan-rich sensory protein
MRRPPRTQHGHQLTALLGFVAASFAAAGLGSRFTLPALDTWYRKLRKPDWTPPDWVFGPVWATLYMQMAVSGWLVYRRAFSRPHAQRSPAKVALVAWGVQLLLNVGWSAAFFGRRSPGAGLVTIVLLWTAIATTAAAALKASRLAGLLLLPYLAWSTFAATLNLKIWQLNR